MSTEPHAYSGSYELTPYDTLVLKGIALLLLLTHHLFYVDNGLYDEYTLFGCGLIQAVGSFSKVCVAMFVFLSGYGIMRSALQNGFSVRKFYARGFTKLYLNYWFIWLLFVPLGTIAFGRSAEQAYGHDLWIRGCIDFFGLSRSAGFDGYNVTWWFYSCILLLYALTPLLIRSTNRLPVATLAVTVLFMALSSDATPVAGPLHYYLFPFALGITSARYALISRICRIAKGRPWLPPVAFLLFCLLRLRTGLYLDGLWTLCCVTLYSVYFAGNEKPGMVRKSLHVIGRHSFNIFLFHTFIYYYFFPEWIYAPRNPLLIFGLLLCVCMILSVAIEKLKLISGFYAFQNRLAGWLARQTT